MSSPAQAQGVQAPAVPLFSQILTVVGVVLPLVLGVLGVTDSALPTLLREEAPPFLAFVSCAFALGHHATLQEWLRTVAALGALAQTTADNTAAPALLPASSAAGDQVTSAQAVQAAAAIAGRLIESSRQGVLATAPTGRHLAADTPVLPAGLVSDETPTEVLPVPAEASPYPPAVPAVGVVATPGV